MKDKPYLCFGRVPAGRAIRCIFCSAKAPQKDAAAIPHAKYNLTTNLLLKSIFFDFSQIQFCNRFVSVC